MSAYQYPDADDELTADFMSAENFDFFYWRRSEELVLKRCFSLAFPQKKRGVKSADVGCGKGRLLSVLSKHSDAVVGVEPSYDRFEEAARAAAELPNAVVINATAAALPKESFDVVLCSHVLQHISVEEQAKLSANIYRMLKPGGAAVVTATFSADAQSAFAVEYWKDGTRIVDAIDEAAFNEAYGKHDVLPVLFFTRGDLLKLFDGFEVIDFGCYHFIGSKRARRDAGLNRRGKLSHAKDAYCVLRKPLSCAQ